MLTTVQITRGRYRGRTGTVPGTLKERADRGITKALVRIGGEPVLLATSSLETAAQLELFTSSPGRTSTEGKGHFPSCR